MASFVSPKWVPQMADGAEVLAGIARAPGVSYAALTPNMRGYEAALAARADEVAIFGSASEGFSRANLNCSIAESLERFRAGRRRSAGRDGVQVRGYVSCVTDCPFDGPTPPAQVAAVAARAARHGLLRDQPWRHDRPGHARDRRRDAGRGAGRGAGRHGWRGISTTPAGRALENIEVSLGSGCGSSMPRSGGLGGCPYAPGAAGNVATEAVAARLAALGYRRPGCDVRR